MTAAAANSSSSSNMHSTTASTSDACCSFGFVPKFPSSSSSSLSTNTSSSTPAMLFASSSSSSKNINNKTFRNTKKKSKEEQDDDTVLARELNELSFQEREKVFEEVHGVAELQDESEDFMETCLLQLEEEIDNLPRGRRRALDRALFLKPSLLQWRHTTTTDGINHNHNNKNRKFCIMFLRADCYHARKAAQRMAKYFTHKLELFGEDKLVKEITLEDMNEDDMEAIQTGSLQLLPEKDRSGRHVWFVSPKDFKYKHWKNHIRYAWYWVMMTLEHEEAQIRGLVDVVYSVGMSGMESTFTDLMTNGGGMLADLPYRIVGLHFCYNDYRLRPAMTLIRMVCGKQTRLRFRTHFGSGIEAKYALMTFGIPIDPIPMRPDGSLKPEKTQQFLEQRRFIEAERRRQQQQQQQQLLDNNTNNNNNNSTFIIEYPAPNDILLGRGRPFQDYNGNRILMRLVDSQRAYYQSIDDRFEKTCLTMKIVKQMKDNGGRFLQRTSTSNNSNSTGQQQRQQQDLQEGWEEVDDSTAREKVSHTFRTKGKTTTKKKKEPKPQTPQKQAVVSPSPLKTISEESSPSLRRDAKRVRYDDTLLEDA